MEFLKDEDGQGAAEYILLFGSIVFMAIAAILIYKSYVNGNSGLNSAKDMSSVRGNVTS